MSLGVKCPSCNQNLSAPESSRGGSVQCGACKQVFTVPADAPTLATPSGGGAWPPGAPGLWAGPTRGDEVYQTYFKLNDVSPTELADWKNWRTTSFSTAGAILLDIFTCEIFGLIYYGLKFGEIPKVSREDFGTGKAIGFSFIPYFNLYWIFKFWLGLCDRVNLQLRLRGMNYLVLSRELAMAICILQVCSVIPYLGCLTAIACMICREIFIGKMQQAINAVAREQTFGAQGFAPPPGT